MKTDKVKEVLEELHFKCGLPVGFINDGQPHEAYNHASDDGCINEAAHQLNQMLIEAKEDGVKFARLKIEELASKEMRDGRHRYSDEIETILEALKAEKDNHADQ